MFSAYSEPAQAAALRRQVIEYWVLESDDEIVSWVSKET
jgi:hypothetical protein